MASSTASYRLPFLGPSLDSVAAYRGGMALTRSHADTTQAIPTRADVEAAAERIAPYVRRTPVLTVEAGALGVGVPLALKLEGFQRTGAFKSRGAFNSLLAGKQADAGVIAASGGNHGMAVALAAHELDVPAEIVVPVATPEVKTAALRAYRANVVLHGSTYPEAYEHAVGRQAETGARFVHAYDQPEIVAGQGTLGLEMASQAGELDTVLLAVGGGGLLAGVSTALGPDVRIVGVEPESIPTLHRALAAGHPIDVPVGGVAADSLGAGRLGRIGFAVARLHRAVSVLVTDLAVMEARRLLWSALRLAVEPGGAVAFAALLSGAYAPAPGERVGIVVCGANTDPADLAGRSG
jgi:threonine dehydratase